MNVRYKQNIVTFNSITSYSNDYVVVINSEEKISTAVELSPVRRFSVSNVRVV